MSHSSQNNKIYPVKVSDLTHINIKFLKKKGWVFGIMQQCRAPILRLCVTRQDSGKSASSIVNVSAVLSAWCSCTLPENSNELYCNVHKNHDVIFGAKVACVITITTRHKKFGMVVSCGRCRIFPREQSSFQPGAEYLEELLWRSCAKPKLLPQPAPHPGLWNPQCALLLQESFSLLGWINVCYNFLHFHSRTAQPEPQAAQARCCSNGRNARTLLGRVCMPWGSMCMVRLPR